MGSGTKRGVKDSSDESRRTQQGLDVKYLLCMQHKLKLPVSPVIYRSETVDEDGLSFICILRPVNPRFSRPTDDTILISTLSHMLASILSCSSFLFFFRPSRHEKSTTQPLWSKRMILWNVCLTRKRFIMLISTWSYFTWHGKSCLTIEENRKITCGSFFAFFFLVAMIICNYHYWSSEQFICINN